jgi:hypothetical protein
MIGLPVRELKEGCAFVNSSPRRDPGLLGLLGRQGFVDLVERQLCRAPDQLLQLVGILDARNLNENAVAAFANDRGLGHAHRIDASAHGFEGR